MFFCKKQDIFFYTNYFTANKQSSYGFYRFFIAVDSISLIRFN